MRSLRYTIATVFLLINLQVLSQPLPGFRASTYKQIDTVALKLYVKNPEGFGNKKNYPVIVFFFGGGWNSGKVSQFEPHANYFSSRGMIAVLADYRVKSRHQTTPFDAVADAKSVIRYLRQHAAQLRIDTSKIVASGGSAGGHLAAAAATVPGLNDASDNLKISCKPNALVLFNPVFDNGPSGYGSDRFGDRYLEISPMHNIKKGTPPTIAFLGTKDDLIPVETAQGYKQKMEEAGCRCDLFLYEDQKHGFFNYRDSSKEGSHYFSETVFQADLFLESLGYLTGKPTIRTFIIQLQ
jgi:acetyl esterase/lipase